jgi:hypothetical protein
MVGRTVRLEVVRFGMSDRMSPVELTQVRDNFRRAVFRIDANYRSREIRIAVRATAAGNKGIELAVEESNVRSAKRVPGGETALRGREMVDYRGAVAA